jgi:L-asparaginase II/GNAT superfamily N-acetyltransferase
VVGLSIADWVNATDASFEPLAAIVRDGHVESVHRGVVAFCDQRGRLLGGAGDPDLPLILRSAAKPFQALAVVRSGAADALGLTQKELAIMCGSHAGRAEHVQVVQGLLSRLGVPVETLSCGPVSHTCSGKHAGMIALALHLGAPVEGYEQPSHPVQGYIAETVARLLEDRSAKVGGESLRAVCKRGASESLLVTTDGCGVPNIRVTYREAAYLMALLAGGADEHLQRVRDAMLAFPEMIAGEGRLDTVLMQAGEGQLVAKAGAEGIFAVGLSSAFTAAGVAAGSVGCIIKIADGSPRAIPVLVRVCLEAYGVSLPSQVFTGTRSRTPESVRCLLHQGIPVAILKAVALRRTPTAQSSRGCPGGDDSLAEHKDLRIVVGRGDEKEAIGFLRKEWPSADEETFGRPLEWIAEPLALIVRHRRKVVAVLRGHFTGGVASVDELMVGRGERNTGLGSLLLSRFEAAARERRCRRVVLRAVKGSVAELFYHNRGYCRECVERKHEFGFDYVRLTKELGEERRRL